MKNFGFTLIELLIAITIGLLVVGFGAVSLNSFYQQQKVESVSQELLSDLILARNYAITNQIPTGSSADTDRVTVTIDNTGLMIIKTQKKDDSDGNDSHTFFSKDITTEGVGITVISSYGNNIAAKFSVTDGRSIGGTASIIITGGSTTENIKIDESGLIYEE